MLYLAEVQRRPTSFGLGGGKTDLKLLACQRGEHNWLAVPGEEVIPADEAKQFSSGVLVLVDLNNNKQVLQVQDAGRQLVKILQNFSRSQERSKTQWEEIEQWKVSLTYQAQELNRRENELQAKEEELEELQAEINKLEEQRHKFSQAQQESQELQKQIELSRKELEVTRLELQKQKHNLEQHQEELAESAIYNPEQSQYIQDLLSWLTEAVTWTNSLKEKLSQSLEIVKNQKKTLQQSRQQLENTANTDYNPQHEEIDNLANHVQSKWLEWQQVQESLADQTTELRVQQTLLVSKQKYSQILNGQIQRQAQLYDQLSYLVTALENDSINQKVDVEALEKVPLNELEELVQSLRRDLQIDMSFVRDQEEELALQKQEMDALKRRIDQANEYDRINLNSELLEEIDRYRILNESLVGSQRNLKEREKILTQHQAVLLGRLGNSSDQEDLSHINIKHILLQLEAYRQQLIEELQRLEAEIQQIQTEISQKEEMINCQTQQQVIKRNQIDSLELSLRENKKVNIEGRTGVYQEIMLPLEGNLEQLRRQLEEVVGGVNKVEGIGEQVAQLQQLMQSVAKWDFSS
ncbi:MAG: pilus motility taxis protein HmpF [Trichodesmium sp. St16_bin4-tuft]|nr:pilus motility taxis protein HmpF [Trichodesmium sp. MAG_R01]MDE5069452.1 pilus motility taxis protein HmpF [Trichodesmium sp. St4_bin8_1]MDE5071921.1 pilus motility taxis protein HmpF [Trichodesmium sp. St5_bin8]MDE5077230.1 pilus motility taxis protein HmpF [Trichodesmium sp. St2_bin6]MDE5091050.1 pilus motility taxis protein HmpF [Trichodesmium sp. St18_bin3_1_1]MDE5100678.1 pilus motility taxis protein HmpF [Trichodesmium sp. St16_bin4-tuft]MDE5102754.1 pilus motility taxis protein Hmp